MITNEEQIRREIIGTFEIDNGEWNTQVIFSRDNTFKYHYSDDITWESGYGIWKQKEFHPHIIILNSEKSNAIGKIRLFKDEEWLYQDGKLYFKKLKDGSFDLKNSDLGFLPKTKSPPQGPPEPE